MSPIWKSTPPASWRTQSCPSQRPPGGYQDALRKIGVDGLRYEEIIILDYTASVPLLSSRLGEYARIDELNYLACRLAGMSQEEKAKFSAALEHGDYGGDLSDIIDLTYRLDCYTLLPEIRNYEDYGYHLVESRRDFYLPPKGQILFRFFSVWRGHHHQRGRDADAPGLYPSGPGERSSPRSMTGNISPLNTGCSNIPWRPEPKSDSRPTGRTLQ